MAAMFVSLRWCRPASWPAWCQSMFQSAYVKRHITESVNGRFLVETVVSRGCREGRRNVHQLVALSTLAGGLVPVPDVHRRTVVYRRPAWPVPRPLATRPGNLRKSFLRFRSGRFRVPVPGMAGPGFDLPADQGAGRLLTPRKTAACFAAAHAPLYWRFTSGGLSSDADTPPSASLPPHAKPARASTELYWRFLYRGVGQ